MRMPSGEVMPRPRHTLDRRFFFMSVDFVNFDVIVMQGPKRPASLRFVFCAAQPKFECLSVAHTMSRCYACDSE